MEQERVKVVVAAEPFVLRSILYDSIARDDRFEPHIQGPHDDVASLADLIGADAVLVSAPTSVERPLVVTVSEAPIVESRIGTTVTTWPYTGVPDLIDLMFTLVRERHSVDPRAGPAARRAPPAGTEGQTAPKGGAQRR